MAIDNLKAAADRPGQDRPLKAGGADRVFQVFDVALAARLIWRRVEQPDQEITGHSEAAMVLYYTHAKEVGAARDSLNKLSVVQATGSQGDGETEEAKEKRSVG